MKTNPFISIITPCYNQGRYLQEAVHSVLNQTFSDFECLVVDDGSSDQTSEVLTNLCSEDPRVKRLQHTNGKNRGLAASRNLGIEAARGEYIGILDADDAWLPDKLEKQVKVFQRFSDVGLVYGKAINVTQNDPNRKMRESNQENCFIQGGIRENKGVNPFQATRMLLWGNLVPCPTPLIRRSVLGSLRFEQGPVCKRFGLHFEDYLMWLLLSTKARFFFIDQPMALYRVHPHQVSKKFIEGTASLKSMDGFEETFDLFVKRGGNAVNELVSPSELRHALGEILFRGKRPLALSELPCLAKYAFRYRKYAKLYEYLANRIVSGSKRRMIST